MRALSRRAHAFGLSAVLALVVTASVGAYLSLLPRFLGRIPHFDKVCHFSGYGLLAVFLDGVLSFRAKAEARTSRFPWAGLAVLAVAGLEELAQGLSPVRECSVWDFAADAGGVVLLLGLARLATRPARARVG